LADLNNCDLNCDLNRDLNQLIFFVKKSSDLNHTGDFTCQIKNYNKQKQVYCFILVLFFYSTFRRLILQALVQEL